MSLNLLDSVKRLFNSEIVSKAAISLGESESGISKAISGVVPSVLSSIVAKATSGEHGATNILQLAKDAAGSDVLDSMGGLFNNNGKNSFLSAGFDTLKSLFGDKLTSVIHSIAGFAGIQTSSASALLSGVAPAALAVVGQHAITNNISASGLVQSLENSKGQILSALPLSLGSIPGLLGLSNATNSLSGTAKQATSAAAAYVKGAEDKAGSKSKFLLPVLLGLLLIGLLIYFLKGCNSASGAGTTAAADTAQTHIDTLSAPAGPVSIKVKLPDGTELDAYKGGIEDRLVTFLLTDYAKLGEDSLKKIWFDFDKLNFKTGSAEITPESQHQIDNIAAILRAFPKSKIKIGGYTDKTGDETVNKKLSKDRAEAVNAALVKASVGGQVAGVDGYGSDFAKFPVTAPESDRVHDRHVSVSVRL